MSAVVVCVPPGPLSTLGALAESKAARIEKTQSVVELHNKIGGSPTIPPKDRILGSTPTSSMLYESTSRILDLERYYVRKTPCTWFCGTYISFFWIRRVNLNISPFFNRRTVLFENYRSPTNRRCSRTWIKQRDTLHRASLSPPVTLLIPVCVCPLPYYTLSAAVGCGGNTALCRIERVVRD